MPSRCAVLILCAAGALLSGGCSTARSPRAHSGTNGAHARPDLMSPAEAERKAEAHARFLTGLSFDFNDQDEQAAREYEKALEAEPANEMLALDLSRRFVQQKQVDRAIAVLKKAGAASEAPASILARLGFLYLQNGDTNAAIEANRRAIKHQPGSIAGYQNLFALYRQSGRTNEARRILEEAARQKNPDAPFLIDLATLYLVEDADRAHGTNIIGSPRAREALNRAATLGPTNLFVLQKLAQGFRLIGEQKKAAEIYVQLLDAFPNIPGLRQELADIYLRANESKRAAEQLEVLARENPTNPQAHYLLGALAYDEKRYADAVEHYRKALLLNPALEQIYYDIAGAKIALNEPREALDYLGQAERKFKQSFVGEFFSGVAYMHLKEYTNALEHLTAAEIIARATETNRLTHSFYFQLGSAYERAGKIPEAEKYFEQCLTLSPDFAEALNYLGYMWAERGTNLDRARQLIEQAVSLEPTNAAFLDSLGWVLFKQGHAQEALPQIEKAVKLNKEPDATLYDHLGDILATLNQPEKARDAWRKSIEIEPNEKIEHKLKGGADGGGSKPES